MSERLFFWRAIDRLAERGIDLWRAEPWHPKHFIEAVAHLPPPLVAPSLLRARRLRPKEIDAARRCWRVFANGDLQTFARLVRTEPPTLAWLLNSLPRVTGHGLRLSRVDQELLRPFSRWRSPAEALHGAPNWRELVMAHGDLFVLTRLWKWTQGTQPVLFAKPAVPER